MCRGRETLAHKAIHSAVQDVGALVVNQLVDVPGTRRNFEPPAQRHIEAAGELRAVFEMPETTREAVRPLGHRLVPARQVVSIRVVVGIAQQDDERAPQIFL